MGASIVCEIVVIHEPSFNLCLKLYLLLQPATELCCRWLYYSLLDRGERRVARAMRDQVDTAIRAAAEEYC